VLESFPIEDLNIIDQNGFLLSKQLWEGNPGSKKKKEKGIDKSLHDFKGKRKASIYRRNQFQKIITYKNELQLR
jgi:hypothetical protein